MVICFDQRSSNGCRTANPDGTQFCVSCGQSLRFALTLHNPDTRIGNYRIEEVLGHGGFGVVYRAVAQTQPKHVVALKETFDSESIRSYQREFAVLTRLKHPNLPSYYEMFEQDGSGYLVMEYVPGQNLAQILERQGGPLLESQVMGYALQICDALAYLHTQQAPLIHRDVKPANIRLTPEGLVKLVDFGLLKEGTQQTQHTRRGLSPAYAPLEQWGAGQQGTDARSDIYSLGATLFQLLTGSEPPAATDRISAHLDTMPPLLHLNPHLSPHVALAIQKALELRADARFQTVKEFKLALQMPLDAAFPSAVSATSISQPQAATNATIMLGQPSRVRIQDSGFRSDNATAANVAMQGAPGVRIQDSGLSSAAASPVSAQHMQPTPDTQIGGGIANQPSLLAQVFPGVEPIGLLFVVLSTSLWSIGLIQPIFMLLGWLISIAGLGYFLQRSSSNKGCAGAIPGIALGAISLFLAPFFLFDCLLNQSHRRWNTPRPAFLKGLAILLFLSSLGAVFAVSVIGSNVAFFAWYLWAFTAEYLFVSKGRRSSVMLAICLFVFIAPLAVLIAALAPRKQAVLP
jgi:hypothetical protein